MRFPPAFPGLSAPARRERGSFFVGLQFPHCVSTFGRPKRLSLQHVVFALRAFCVRRLGSRAILFPFLFVCTLRLVGFTSRAFCLSLGLPVRPCFRPCLFLSYILSVCFVSTCFVCLVWLCGLVVLVLSFCLFLCLCESLPSNMFKAITHHRKGVTPIAAQ